MLSLSDQQHYASFGLAKHFGIPANYSIHLLRCDRLPILTNMQTLSVNHISNLFRTHPPARASQAVDYGLLDFHITI